MTAIAVLLVASLQSAAGQAAPPVPSVPAPKATAVAQMPGYTFQPGDVVAFKFPFSPELDFDAPVRPDGAVFFPYLGDVQMTGLTVTGLAELLRRRYAKVLREPEITIMVRSFQVPRVFVAGEVLAPGKVDYRPGMTVTQALYTAGGFRETANRKQVILLRHAAPGALKVSTISLSVKQQTLADVALLPDDIVLVPRSRISRLGQIIQQYSRDLLPISSLGVFFDLVGSTNASAAINAGGSR